MASGLHVACTGIWHGCVYCKVAPPKINPPLLIAVAAKPSSIHRLDVNRALHYEGYPAASPLDKNCRALPAPSGSVELLLCIRRLQKGIKHAQLGSARHPRAKPPR
jgi:hypothetical protein